jgi:hypothetical protein
MAWSFQHGAEDGSEVFSPSGEFLTPALWPGQRGLSSTKGGASGPAIRTSSTAYAIFAARKESMGNGFFLSWLFTQY